VTPDIMCLAKGLTGGYLPVAATLATDQIYDTFLGRYDEYRHFFHGHTYTGNALGCAAALATLGLLADGKIVKAVEQKAAKLRAALAPLAADPHVGDIRQTGLMCGIELVADRATRASFPPGRRTGYHICLSLRDRGIFLRPLGDVIVLMPPLSSTEDELTQLAASVRSAVVEHLGA
jgi:adenosylmethionine-8-amino-7-oxononanoate aminotransferase